MLAFANNKIAVFCVKLKVTDASQSQPGLRASAFPGAALAPGNSGKVMVLYSGRVAVREGIGGGEKHRSSRNG